VDDGETNRKLVRLMLEKRGIETAVACNGREGVDAVARGRNRRSSGRFGRAWESVDIDLALKGLHGENIGRRW
jgi:CheY-like chemotaxis protein